ncbi:hypothetical protein D3C76_326940 [compost metagenome]
MLCFAETVFLQKGGIPLDRRYRRFEFVGHIDHKIIAEGLDAAQLLKHNIEVTGHVTYFTDPVRFIQINIEVAFGDFLGRLAEIRDRR